MTTKNAPVSVRFSDSQRQKLLKLSERENSTVSETVRGIVAAAFSGVDLETALSRQGARMIEQQRKALEETALALIPALMQRLQGQSGNSQQAPAPAIKERDWSAPIVDSSEPATVTRRALTPGPEKSLIALQCNAYDYLLTEEVRARARALMLANGGAAMTEQEAQLTILQMDDKGMGGQNG